MLGSNRLDIEIVASFLKLFTLLRDLNYKMHYTLWIGGLVLPLFAVASPTAPVVPRVSLSHTLSQH